jgi:hypothetical protein
MKKGMVKIGMFFLLIIVLGCTKEDTYTQTQIQTTLLIQVTDESGIPVQDAQVKLYGSENDMFNNTNALLTTQMTNSQGEVRFSPLSSYSTYYWFASKGCSTNVFSINKNMIYLTPNTVNAFPTTLKPTGTLTFKNTSSNPYNVYVNNSLKFQNMSGSGTIKSYLTNPGIYTIRVEQQSGYLFNPTIITYVRELTCGNELLTTFPN